MNLVYKGLLYKLLGVIRYFIARIFFGKKFQCNMPSILGSKSSLHILEKGKIICGGRIIVDDYGMLYSKGQLKIGDKFTMNRFSRIVCHEKITIGNHVTIGQMVSILDHDHKFERQNESLILNGYATTPISIGNYVWIGDKVTILRGVTIGNNVVIAANSLVNKNVEDNTIVGGVPCKLLKRLEN